MLADKYLVELINNIRKCPFFKKYDYVLKNPPIVNVNYIENQGLELYRICFNNWDEIAITNTEINFFPEHGSKENLLSYNNWEELYKIFNIKRKR